MSQKIPFLLTVIAITVFMSWWLQNLIREAQQTPERVVAHLPDYTLDNVALTSIDSDGTVKYRLIATQARHYLDDDSYELDEVYVESLKKDQPPFMLTTKQAQMNSTGDIIHLKGDVEIRRLPYKGQATLRIQTQDVTIDTENETFSTQREFIAHSKNNTLRGRGLEIDNKNGLLKILSNAEAVYVRD